MKTAPEPPRKKPYSPPRLTKYGDLVTMTAAASMDATNMDGGPNNLKS